MPSVHVEVPVGKSWIMGRNGLVYLKRVEFYIYDTGEVPFAGQTAEINGISRRDMVINGGLTLPADKLDELCQKWLTMRGFSVSKGRLGLLYSNDNGADVFPMPEDISPHDFAQTILKGHEDDPWVVDTFVLYVHEGKLTADRINLDPEEG